VCPRANTFLLYRPAMLEVAFKDSSEGVYMKTRKEADLFDVTHVSLNLRQVLS